MAASGDVRSAYMGKARAELAELSSRGVVMAGNAFASVLLVKGEPDAGELADGLLAGDDGRALRSALSALGYAPEDWAGLCAVDGSGASLTPGTMRLALATLDPATVIACDDVAAAALRDALADDLASLKTLGEAVLEPGYVAHVLGMRVMALGGFAAALADPRAKQLMWARLKQLPPLADPY